MSRKCAIQEFNLDVQRVLLKALMGEPKDRTFASSISGADALSITSQVTLHTIETKCDDMLKAFMARDYRKSFSWVDNISEVTDKQKIEELDNEVIGRIKSENFEHLFLAVPDMVEWTAIDGFKFKESDDELHPDIFLLDFLKTVRNPADISCQYLKLRRIYQVHADTGLVETKWSVYYCLNCEIARSGKSYILTEGRWYEIDPSFVSQVNKRLKNIKKCRIKLTAGKNEKENDYSQRLHETDCAYYALMDRKIIHYGGGHSQMEFCDLFTKDRKLLHIKRYAGSSVLSHLFSQGVNSARTFLSDVEFRRKVKETLPASHKFNAEEPPVSRKYEIVFGIISETADYLPDKLPFFSKITLMRAMQELEGVMGFKMSLAGIKVGT